MATRTDREGLAVMNFAIDSLVTHLNLPNIELEFESVMKKGSMEMIPNDWVVLASATARALSSGVNGVVILHGTDTMHYTAAALSFMLNGLSVPVVLTGSILPGGDPGSDALRNLRDAVSVAAFADLAEVCVVFSADASGSRRIIIRGCRAKKIYSNAMNAFASINVPPIGYTDEGKISYSELERSGRSPRMLKLLTDLNSNVALIKLTPAITPRMLAQSLEGTSGAVLEGTGIGHMRLEFCDVMREFRNPVVMSTQTIYGGERLGMYEDDKPILGIENLIPAHDMTSETAFVKLMWALGQSGDLRSIMLSNIAGEISRK